MNSIISKKELIFVSSLHVHEPGLVGLERFHTQTTLIAQIQMC